MGDRTRLTPRHPRTVLGALGVTVTAGALLLVGPAASSQAAGQPATVAVVAIAPAAPAAAVAAPLFDPAGLAKIAAYVTSVIPAPAPPAPPAPPAAPPVAPVAPPVATTPAAPPAAKKAVTPAVPKAPKVKAPKKAVAPAAPAAPAAAACPAAGGGGGLLGLVNAARAQNCLAPLTASSCAAGFASSWAQSLATADPEGGMTHQSLTPILSSCGAHGAGENIAYGQTSAQAVFDAWMASPGHRANILNPRFTAMGSSSATAADGTIYWAQDFIG